MSAQSIKMAKLVFADKLMECGSSKTGLCPYMTSIGCFAEQEPSRYTGCSVGGMGKYSTNNKLMQPCRDNPKSKGSGQVTFIINKDEENTERKIKEISDTMKKQGMRVSGWHETEDRISATYSAKRTINT